MIQPEDPRSYEVQWIDVPGGWIYHGSPLSHPVLVSDPAQWTLNETAAQLLALLSTLNTKVDSIMATLADIQSAETDEATAINSVLAEIAQLQTDLAAAQASGADSTTIQAIVDQIHANTAKLTAVLPAPTTPVPPATITGAGSATTTGATGTDTPPTAA